MLGHEGVTTALYQSVVTWLPQVAAQMRVELGLDETTLQIPGTDDIHPVMEDAVQVGRFPTLMIQELETGPRSSTRQSAGSGDLDTYRIRYKFRVYMWVMGSGYRRTGVLIKRLATAVRTTLLVNKLLHEAGQESVVFDPATIKESFSDVEPDGAANFLAGSYIEFEVMTTELLRATVTDSGLTAKLALNVGLMVDEGV